MVVFTALLLALGAIGGEGAKLLHLPLPWMLGSLLAAAVAVAVVPHRFPPGYQFPMGFRMVFIGAIGVLIGAQVDGALLAQWSEMLVSLAGITIFVFVAHGVNFWLFRRIGGYDRKTAFFCGTPGGVMESIALGEQAGADIRVLALQQFLRIILVVSVVPVGLSILHGEVLGSSAGLSFQQGEARLVAVPILLAVAIGGMLLGRALRLPAGQLTGPLLVAALLGATGLVEINPPGWVLAVAQVVIGTSLGVRFIGVTLRMLRLGLWMAILSVGSMLAIGALLSVAIHAVTGQSTEVLILSFAPGGVTEMGLVALSLSANPAVVTLHHLYRITITVLEMSFLSRWVTRSDP
ncbi:AbrB family transcriptional regulator [Oceaniglobus trochenteri]|uniref:AbrB family transcriptional regulator n=1 Tax=Oceaniglobus trochenteri TaxID=2763260 RepID=UPI001CFF7C9D